MLVNKVCDHRFNVIYKLYGIATRRINRLFHRRSCNSSQNAKSAQQVPSKSTLCTDPIIGKGLQSLGFGFLMNSCELDDVWFEKIYGVSFSRKDRMELQKRIEKHWIECAYCRVASYECIQDLRKHDDLFAEKIA